MKIRAALVIIFLSGLLSCSDNKAVPVSTGIATTKTDSVQKDSPFTVTLSPVRSIPDTIKRFRVDDYPLTDDMFGKGDNGREIKSGGITSIDKVWFTNQALKQTLVVELYTDNFRTAAFHFQDQNIPTALIKRMELHTDDGELASQQQKEKDFKGFVSKAREINKNYFRTNKGFKIGDSKQMAINSYGEPDRKTVEENVEVLEWDFTGDLLYDGKTDLKGKPLAKDNYGHQVTMFFRNNKMAGVILHNDIP